jgi:hypothetical protein
MERGQTSCRTARKSETQATVANPSWNFSLVPLLLNGQSISSEARRALSENRMKDAAVILMQDYGLTCVEAGDLLNVPAC